MKTVLEMFSVLEDFILKKALITNKLTNCSRMSRNRNLFKN